MEQSDVVSVITDSLLKSPTRSMTGAVLSARIREAYPQFAASQFGVRNLREFINQNVPNAVELSRAGADIVYSVNPENTSTGRSALSPATRFPRSPKAHRLQPSLLGNPRIWKTFVSPKSAYKLSLDKVTQELRVLSPEAPIANSADHVLVPALSAVDLKSIAASFIKTLPAPQQPILLPILEKPEWWLELHEILRSMGLNGRYEQHRRSAVEAEFNSRLSRIVDVKPASSSEIAAGVRPSDSEVPLRKGATGSEELLREIAIAAVGRMTEAELRQISLPLGRVVDSLRR